MLLWDVDWRKPSTRASEKGFCHAFVLGGGCLIQSSTTPSPYAEVEVAGTPASILEPGLVQFLGRVAAGAEYMEAVLDAM